MQNGTWKPMPSVFEFICELCDPEKEGKSHTLRLLGLTLANSVLEILGTGIAEYAPILKIAQNQLSRALLRVRVVEQILALKN